MVKLLLCAEAGSNSNVQNWLHGQAEQRYVDIMDGEGRTALHIAAELSDEDLMNTLLKAGADLRLKDVKGLTPEDIIEANGYYILRRLDICQVRKS